MQYYVKVVMMASSKRLSLKDEDKKNDRNGENGNLSRKEAKI